MIQELGTSCLFDVLPNYLIMNFMAVSSGLNLKLFFRNNKNSSDQKELLRSVILREINHIITRIGYH